MYRPPKTNRAVRLRPLADVLTGDSQVRESVANITNFGIAGVLRCNFQAAGDDQFGVSYAAKHIHTMAGHARSFVGGQLVYPDNEPASYHYEYTIGFEGEHSSAIQTMPIVVWRHVPVIASITHEKRYTLLPLPPIHTDANDRWCVSDHMVEIGELDYAARENVVADNNYAVGFGVMFYNTSSQSVALNDFVVHAHAVRYTREQPTFDPATIR